MSTARGDELAVIPPAPKDQPTVDGAGDPLIEIEGVRHARLRPHVDHRGSLTEVMDFAQPFWDEPVVYAYRVTLRPGRIKGWGMHKLQADRYLLVAGSIRTVLFDGREESPTRGHYAQFHFTEEAPALLLIPPGVWHASQSTSDRDAVILNFPTQPFDKADPDKYRIDPHSGEIPFDWELRDG